MTYTMHMIKKRITRVRNQRNKLDEMKNFHRDEDGQAMTEFVIVLPFLLFLILGTVQLMMIANAAYFGKLANFYALRVGIVHFENIQFDLSNDDLDDIMEEEATRVLLPMLPSTFTDFSGNFLASILQMNMVDLDIGTNQNRDLNSNPGPNNQANWLTCNTEYAYHLYIPFAGGIIANIWWWTEFGLNPSTNLFLKQDGLLLREPPLVPNFPMWPYINIKSRSWDFSSGRNPDDSVEWLERHAMAIQRRVYRQPGGNRFANRDEQ